MLRRVDSRNMMSVTMLLRRTPELDVANLGQLNLISSTTLGQPTPSRSRSTSPQRIVSNNTSPVNAEPTAPRAVRMGRSAVVPHAVHLRELQSYTTHGVVCSGLGQSDTTDRRLQGADAKVHNSRIWHIPQHGTSPEQAMRGTAQQAQRGSTGRQSLEESKGSRSLHAKFGNRSRNCAQLDLSPEEAAFDLYHHSQKLALQLPSGIRRGIRQHEASATAAAAMQDRPLPDNRASSISPASAVTPGASSIQGPALDTDAVAAGSSTHFAGAANSFSMQPSAQPDLMRKSSTVRFATPHPKVNVSPSPSADTTAEANHLEGDDGTAVLQSHDAHLSLADGGTSGRQSTLSMSSTASSLKSVLKKAAKSNSAAMLSHCSGRALDISDVRFALCPNADADQRSLNDGAVSSSSQKDGLQKQGSESFPSWLVGG